MFSVSDLTSAIKSASSLFFLFASGNITTTNFTQHHPHTKRMMKAQQLQTTLDYVKRTPIKKNQFSLLMQFLSIMLKLKSSTMCSCHARNKQEALRGTINILTYQFSVAFFHFLFSIRSLLALFLVSTNS